MSSDTKHPKLLQVYNISTAANNDVIRQLFQYFGRIEEFQVYPVLVTANTKQKVAYIRYEREKSVLVAQHLTNTVFFDRALVCVPATSNNIPDEDTALQNSAALGKRVLPAHVVNKIEENDGQKMLYTIDPTLTNLGLPPYPPLGADLDLEKVEETRRTIYVGGLKKDVVPEDVINFFNTIGEVMYLRMANAANHDCAYCYIEFTNQKSVPQALQNDGVEFQGQPIRIQHSRVAIVKPQQKTNDQAMEEIEEAMRRRDKGERSPSRKRSRSPRSSSRRWSRSPRRSRDRERERSKSRRDERDSKKDRDDRDSRKDKDRDRDRKKEKDRGKDNERSRDRSRDREDRLRDKERKDKSRDEKRERDRRSERDRDSRKDDRDKDKKKDREKRSKDSDRPRSRSPKDSRKERRSRTRSPDRKKKRENEDDKRSRDKDSSSSSKSRKDNTASDKGSSGSLVSSDLNRGKSLDAVETSLRERLLAKQLEKKRRGSDEMDISD